MPINIYEQPDLTTVDVEGEFMPKLHSKYVNVVQPLIDDLTYTLVPYAASAQELIDAIQSKLAELRQEFSTRALSDSIVASYDQALSASLLYTPITPTAESTRYYGNIAIVSAAIPIIEALANKAAVDGFLISNLLWTA